MYFLSSLSSDEFLQVTRPSHPSTCSSLCTLPPLTAFKSVSSRNLDSLQSWLDELRCELCLIKTCHLEVNERAFNLCSFCLSSSKPPRTPCWRACLLLVARAGHQQSFSIPELPKGTLRLQGHCCKIDLTPCPPSYYTNIQVVYDTMCVNFPALPSSQGSFLS